MANTTGQSGQGTDGQETVVIWGEAGKKGKNNR